MTENGIESRLAALTERIGAVKQTAEAAHSRMDRYEAVIREDLSNIIDDMKTVMAWMNHKKGHDAAMLIAASAVGGIVSFIASKLF